MRINNTGHSTAFKKIYDYSGNYNVEEMQIADDIRSKMAYSNPITKDAKRPDLLLMTSGNNEIIVKSGRIKDGGWDYTTELEVGKYDKSHPFDTNDIKKCWKKNQLKNAFLISLYILIPALILHFCNKTPSNSTKKESLIETLQLKNKQNPDTVNIFKGKI